jgi:hypothetical protein
MARNQELQEKVPNFIGVVGNFGSRKLVKKIALFLWKHYPRLNLSREWIFPIIAPFWKMGYPAVMITDTAFYRNPNYHSGSDTIETLDFDRMAELLTGIKQVVVDMTSSF